MTLMDGFGFDDLPEVDLTAPAATPGMRAPRFDEDTSELPDKACWALQNLFTRRYLTKEANREPWAWMMEHRKVIASRVSELDLRLRIVEDLEVAYLEPVLMDNPAPYSRKVLHRKPLGTYASIITLHLAKIARTSHDEHVLISRDDIHELFANVSHSVDRDHAMMGTRIDEAIRRLVKADMLIPSRGDEHSYIISPIVLAIMSAQMIEALQRAYEQLLHDDTDTDGDVDEAPTLDAEQDSEDSDDDQ
ncbi:DUF4194 domain-containing protein [Mycolicibacterium sp. 018/SC-01/001]|uniref:DUF4194 domain-containing protein n=1 Tax=Mycolicibacterium sp. 018/SC-01/001 TaxID=2592069 RepID=UPI00118020B1|nr:DUF4194 domain-containing protein [Mycolicibacterium sp. 018/SC-01/001]